MLTADEKAYILANAYVPEHSVDLMVGISGGEPFLLDDCLVFWKAGELILNGYPFSRAFDLNTFEETASRLRRRFRPARISFIAPQQPAMLSAGSGESASDDYFTLDLQQVPMPPAVKRNIRNASRRLTVEKAESMDSGHRQIANEFIARAKPGPRVERLLDRMPDYLASRSGGIVLSARDAQGKLNAFYVLDMAPVHFCTYIIGCYSRKPYITGASDLLMDELVRIARQTGKSTLHLGLGINEGLRRFKRKWGGIPARPYRMGVVDLKVISIFSGIREFLRQR